jgi:uncharacterized protein (TIRG00374 family)
MRARVLVFGKLSLGLALLGFLIAKSDPSSLLENVYSLDLIFVLVVLVLPHVAMWLSCVKWQLLLAELGIMASVRHLFALYMIGSFFNNFLPTMVGGDVVKAYQLGREAGDPASVIAATFMERFVGLAALVSLLPLVLLQKNVIEAVPILVPLVFGVIVGYLMVLCLVFSSFPQRLPGAKSNLGLVRRLSPLLEKARRQVRLFRHCGWALLASYLISLLFYLVTATGSWAAARSTGADVGFDYVLSVVPVILLAGLLPISLNGLGITESGYVVFLGLAGVSTVDALTMALLVRLRVFLTAILGGLIFLRYRPSVALLGGSRRTMVPSDDSPTHLQPDPSRHFPKSSSE